PRRADAGAVVPLPPGGRLRRPADADPGAVPGGQRDPRRRRSDRHPRSQRGAAGAARQSLLAPVARSRRRRAAMSAPVEGLETVLRPFGASTMLPGAAYTSDAVLAWERRHLFAGSWLCLGRTAELADGVTQRAVMAGDLSVLLTFPGGRAFESARDEQRGRTASSITD